ncbi:MAG TPA: response regulator, partial [Gaiellaceae bacterium]
MFEETAGNIPSSAIHAALDQRGTVTYPLAPQIKLASNGEGSHTLADGGYVLVVDDEPQVQQLIARILERHGFRCELAASAEEARKLLESKENNFQLMLCDVNMPGESGLELLSSTLVSHPEVAALMVTGADDPKMAENAIEIG